MSEGILRPGAVALVTGAGSGIGLAIARRLVAAGVRVIAAGRRRETLEAAFAGSGGEVLIHPLDVTDGPAVAALPNALPKDWRQVDILVANAGSDVGGRRRFGEGAIEDWAQTIETNVTGVFRICHALLPGMLERARGHIVILGSVSGQSVYPLGNAYSASKHAVHAFASLLREDYRRAPVRITEILPGMVRTGFAEARHRGDRAEAEAYYDSWPATLEPDDIAAAALFALQQPAQVNIAQITVTPTGDK